MLDLIGLIIAI